MNFPYFIAKRVAFSGKKSFSTIIIRIAIAAIALSVSVMIIATSFVSGFKSEISEKIFGFWGHIQAIHFESNRSFEVTPIQRDTQFYHNLDTIQSVTYNRPLIFLGRLWDYNQTQTTRGGVRQVQVFAEKAGIIKTNKELEGIVLKGVSDDYDWEFFEDYLLEGAILDLSDTSASKGILISKQTSKRLKLGIGDKLVVYFVEGEQQRARPFKVQGIFKTGLEEYDKKFALIDIRQIQQLNGWSANEVGGFEIFLDDIRDLDLYWKHIYEEQLPPDLFAQTIREMYPNLFGWLDLQDINVQFILLLMILVAIINMTTALMILIYERTNMIGILKALGNTNWQVRKIFLYYAAYIITIGLFWGNFIGISFCFLQDYFGIIKLQEEAYYVSVAPVDISWTTIILLNAGTLFVTLLAMLVPSYLVTRISPVQAVRYK
jgi:lipoprotein-releasing system permease protein